MSSFYSSLALASKIIPEESDLSKAVAQDSMPAVFTILAIWKGVPHMLDEEGNILPAMTTSALLTAISHSRSDIVSLILAVSKMFELPVLDAVRAGSVSTLQTFLWHGWDINEPVERDGPSALGYAVHSTDLVVWFLEQKADPNAGYLYDNALSRAALGGSMEIIDMLLLHGGNVEHGDVLHWAVERQTEAREVVALLLERGAPPNRLRFDGVEPAWSVFGLRSGIGSPLHRAVELDKVDVVVELLKHGADQGMANTFGRTPRQLAGELGRTGILSIMDVHTVG